MLPVQKELRELADKEIASHSQRFFKTGKGEYGEGDKFLGVRVPLLRQLVKKHRGVSVAQALKMLASSFHEERLLALLFLIDLFKRGDTETRKTIYTRYLASTRYINNWDLVDLSAHYIVGAYLDGAAKDPLYELAVSPDIWERRIAIMATFHDIRKRKFEDALKISAILVNDTEDLIHKAVGWMLREIGKRDVKAEERFLKKHYRSMARTMLRYAIEKLPEQKRQRYLKGEI